MKNDIMKALAEARPHRLDPDHVPTGPCPGRLETVGRDGPVESARPRRRERRWTHGLAARLAVPGAAAGVTLAVIAGVALTSGGGANEHSTTLTRSDPAASAVLLAAATRAEQASPARGEYWHVESESTLVSKAPSASKSRKAVEAVWTPISAAKPGYTYYRRLEPQAEPFWSRQDDPFWSRQDEPVLSLSDRALTIGEMWVLPSDPERLEAMLKARSMGHEADEQPAPSAETRFYLSSLTDLVANKPVRPGTRAAAFRLLAGVPGVEDRGRGTDPLGRSGLRVLIPDLGGSSELLLDPETTRILSVRWISNGETPSGVTVYIKAGWTDDLPIDIQISRPQGPPVG